MGDIIEMSFLNSNPQFKCEGCMNMKPNDGASDVSYNRIYSYEQFQKRFPSNMSTFRDYERPKYHAGSGKVCSDCIMLCPTCRCINTKQNIAKYHNCFQCNCIKYTFPETS